MTENARQTTPSFTVACVSSREKEPPIVLVLQTCTSAGFRHGLQKKKHISLFVDSHFPSACTQSSWLHSPLCPPASRTRRASAPRRTAASSRAAACAPPRCPRRVAPRSPWSCACPPRKIRGGRAFRVARGDDARHARHRGGRGGRYRPPAHAGVLRREVHRALGPPRCRYVARSPSPATPRGTNNALFEIRRPPADVSARHEKYPQPRPTVSSDRAMTRFPDESFKRRRRRSRSAGVDPQTNTRLLRKLFTTSRRSLFPHRQSAVRRDRAVRGRARREGAHASGRRRWSGSPSSPSSFAISDASLSPTAFSSPR